MGLATTTRMPKHSGAHLLKIILWETRTYWETATHFLTMSTKRIRNKGDDVTVATDKLSIIILSVQVLILITTLFTIIELPLASLAFSSNQNVNTKNRRRIQINSSTKCKSIIAETTSTNILSMNVADKDTAIDDEDDNDLSNDDNDGRGSGSGSEGSGDTRVGEDAEFLKRELDKLESMEKILEEIEEYCNVEGMCDDDDNADEYVDDDEFISAGMEDIEDMETIFSFLEEGIVGRNEDDDGNAFEFDNKSNENKEPVLFSQGLEEALLQGVVPVDAGVGSGTLPGDWDFDPLNLADKDYIKQAQYRLLDLLPGGNPNNDPPPPPRPSALVLRDYREAEIRHGRLAMLAVIIWPIQEKIDRLLLDEDKCGPLLYGPITLPYLPLFMTLVMMLLGYLDIYAKDIQEEEDIGDAFLPGDCFWDPLRILEGAPATMKRNMQERELFNGRVAMVAFAAFVFEEATSHQAIVNIPSNEILFVPAYQIPIVQEWLDSQFVS